MDIFTLSQETLLAHQDAPRQPLPTIQSQQPPSSSAASATHTTVLHMPQLPQHLEQLPSPPTITVLARIPMLLTPSTTTEVNPTTVTTLPHYFNTTLPPRLTGHIPQAIYTSTITTLNTNLTHLRLKNNYTPALRTVLALLYIVAGIPVTVCMLSQGAPLVYWLAGSGVLIVTLTKTYSFASPVRVRVEAAVSELNSATVIGDSVGVVWRVSPRGCEERMPCFVRSFREFWGGVEVPWEIVVSMVRKDGVEGEEDGDGFLPAYSGRWEELPGYSSV